MKKLATLFTLMAGVGLSFGQGVIHNPGVVSFQNTETGGGNHKVYIDVVGGQLMVGTQYAAELYYMNTTTSALTPLPSTISRFKPSTTSAPGTWNGPSAAQALPAGYGGVDVFDDGSGETGDLFPVILAVRVWNLDMFPSWEAAQAGTGKGDSGQFTYTQRSSVPASPTDIQMLTQKAFVAVVPEPSAIALGVLGVAGLLLIRRRK